MSRAHSSVRPETLGRRLHATDIDMSALSVPPSIRPPAALLAGLVEPERWGYLVRHGSPDKPPRSHDWNGEERHQSPYSQRGHNAPTPRATAKTTPRRMF